MADTFIFRREWLDNIASLDVDTQDQILSDLARYGAGLPLQHADNPIVSSFVDTQKKRIDISIAAYDTKVEMSKNAGRKGIVNKDRLFELACAGWKAKEIAEALNCSVSTVQHSEEWKRARQTLKKDLNQVQGQEYNIFDF